ncbi:MAG: hypothetical protein CMM16_04465 [Rhodospirillaceae bacterium]|nr:hypothetical protein [Rhodospirillaceae bacterium]
MRSHPDARELLNIAEHTLASQVAPDLSSGQRYNVALITAAIGIARRELAGGATAWPDELAALYALYGNDGLESDDQALHRLNQKFAADLRAGNHEKSGANRKNVAKLLREDVLARLAEDNPRYEK